MTRVLTVRGHAQPNAVMNQAAPGSKAEPESCRLPWHVLAWNRL